MLLFIMITSKSRPCVMGIHEFPYLMGETVKHKSRRRIKQIYDLVIYNLLI
jgi:hypothetical protein